jgi:hypothetical protein
MKLFTKEIDKKLFAQYPKGNNLEEQMVVGKIFNPYGNGRWYLVNSDPTDPDYLWAIVQMGRNVEIGSVSRKELESIRVSPFRFPLERDLGFRPVNAYELWKGLRDGKFYKDGGFMEQSENKEMVLSQAEELEHHVEEFEEAAKKSNHVPAWIVAKTERAATDLSDSAHYLDSQNELKREEKEGEEEYAHGGEVKWQEAEYGDSALVISENKMGIIMKPYGRKFHLKFVDGTEKTYDANDLKFFKDMDEFDLGGETGSSFSIVYYESIPTRGGERMTRQATRDTGKGSLESMMENAKDKVSKFGYEYADIIDMQKQGIAAKVKKDGSVMKFAEGGDTSSPNTEFMKWFVDWSKGVNKYVYVSITKPNEFSSPVKDDSGKIVILDVIEKKGDADAKKYLNEILKKADELGVSIYLQPIPRTHNLKSQEHKDKITKDYLVKYYQKFGFENTDGGFMVRAPKMAEGGEVKFKDKVASLKASLLKRKKVPKAVQKDYGETFSPAEAEDSAKRIVGAQTARERLMMRIKSKKKK